MGLYSTYKYLCSIFVQVFCRRAAFYASNLAVPTSIFSSLNNEPGSAMPVWHKSGSSYSSLNVILQSRNVTHIMKVAGGRYE